MMKRAAPPWCARSASKLTTSGWIPAQKQALAGPSPCWTPSSESNCARCKPSPGRYTGLLTE
eukprot:10565447-Karenia_brevis.AAC.1